MSNICLDCGLCCDGAIFPSVVVRDPGQRKVLAGLGIAVVTSGAGPVFKLPCPAFNGCCSIYDRRPTACRDYRCELLKRHDEGAVSTDAALTRIRTAIELRARLRARVAASGRSARLSLQELKAQLAGPLTADAADMLLDLCALEAVLVNHFLAPGSPATSPPAARS